MVWPRPCLPCSRPRGYWNSFDLGRAVQVRDDLSRSILPPDGLLRASDPGIRKKYVAMVEAVQQKGGEVLIFSSMHESGQREQDTPLLRSTSNPSRVELNQLTGIAAILTFPLDVEVVEAEEREAEEERKRQEQDSGDR